VIDKASDGVLLVGPHGTEDNVGRERALDRHAGSREALEQPGVSNDLHCVTYPRHPRDTKRTVEIRPRELTRVHGDAETAIDSARCAFAQRSARCLVVVRERDQIDPR